MKIVSIPYTNEQVYRKVPFYEQIAHPVGRFVDNHEIRDEVWDWCEASLAGEWRWWPNNLRRSDPRCGRDFEFDVANSAMLFKLRWGGAL